MENIKNKNNIKFDISVHKSIEGRKKYKAKLWIIFICLIIVLCGCAVMFYYSNYEWKPDDDFKPHVFLETTLQKILFSIATVISIVSIVLVTIYCFKDISKFYKTQLEYFETKEFKDKKESILKKDLSKIDKKTLKWYKKLGYLTSAQLIEILNNKKK